MKSIKQYLKEELFSTPMTTTGMGNIQAPTENICSSGDIPQAMCIDIKTGKLYKRRKKFRRYRI